jgi:hypothetical protein
MFSQQNVNYTVCPNKCYWYLQNKFKVFDFGTDVIKKNYSCVFPGQISHDSLLGPLFAWERIFFRTAIALLESKLRANATINFKSNNLGKRGLPIA